MLSLFSRLAPAGVALVVAASLLGCPSKSQPSAAPAASASAAASSRADLFASPDDLLPPALLGDAGPAGAAGGGDLAAEPERGLEIVLRDAGAEPRAPLTYDLAVGKPQTVVLSFATTMKQDGQPSGGAGDMPPLRLTLSVVAAEKPSADRTIVQARVTKAELAPGAKGIPPEALAEMGALSKALESIGATFAVSKHGVIDDAELSGDPEAQAATASLLPLIENALDRFFVPMPEEAVGVGAEWTVGTPPAHGAPGGGVDKTYVLKARSATTATVHEEQHEETSEQPIGDPQAPPGATIAVVSKEASTLNVRLTGVASSASSEEDAVMTAHDPTTSPPKVVVTRVKRSLKLESR